MFEKPISAKQFLEALKQLERATTSSKPVALNNAVKRVLGRASGFEGANLNDLLDFIANPPKPAKTARKKSSKAPKLRPDSQELQEEILSALDSAIELESAFNQLVDRYSATCSAPAIKKAAAAFAASAVPPNKPAAIKLLKGERANRLRTRRKMKESAKATPW